jgi:hypothetical protein
MSIDKNTGKNAGIGAGVSQVALGNPVTGAVTGALTTAFRGGKHSGSGSDRNYNDADANAAFKAITGRDLNSAELNWLRSRGDVNKVGHDVAATNLANGYLAKSQNILNQAQAVYGLKNFTLDDANKLRDQLYLAGDQKSYDMADQNISAALANRKQDELTNPTVSAGDQAKHSGTVNDIFQSTLGRPPTQYEADHFSKQLAQGDDPLILQQTLQQSGEYLDKKASQFRDQQAQQLQGFQQQAFEKATPTIISSYMKAGRLNASGVNSALASAQADLTNQNSQYLAGLSRQDFLNSQGQAQNIFAQNTAPSVMRAQQLSQNGYTLPFNLGQQGLARGNELSDYYRQQSDFNRYLQSNRDAADRAGRYGLYGNVISGIASGSTASLAR